ncbi:5-formyltetrahydrofolate cyclo-ligase [Novosphingobium sp. TH158]|nr:5-formyltetrahydrofolate cyclo-ligase [Novosphingobium sp. TH158]
MRARLKQERREFVAAIPDWQRGLLFRRPPSPLVEMIPDGAVISVYYEQPAEAPASHYARWFFERGHRIALPWFADRASPMQFREWTNPFEDGLRLEADPFDKGGLNSLQPRADAAMLVPDVMFCPLVGFSAEGGRIGMGGGHYDRWLGADRPALAIGLGWDCQLVEELPLEPHDAPLDAVVTPTRLYWKES